MKDYEVILESTTKQLDKRSIYLFFKIRDMEFEDKTHFIIYQKFVIERQDIEDELNSRARRISERLNRR